MLKLKPTLFWDCDFEKIDPVKNRRFVIERVLALGDIDDFRQILEFYGAEKIKEVVLKSRALNLRSLNFWCLYFNINQEQCLRKQLIQKQNPFWKR